MNIQTDINERMRGILVDWMVEIQIKFKLQSETLYIAVNLMDRYLEKNTCHKRKITACWSCSYVDCFKISRNLRS